MLIVSWKWNQMLTRFTHLCTSTLLVKQWTSEHQLTTCNNPEGCSHPRCMWIWRLLLGLPWKYLKAWTYMHMTNMQRQQTWNNKRWKLLIIPQWTGTCNGLLARGQLKSSLLASQITKISKPLSRIFPQSLSLQIHSTNEHEVAYKYAISPILQ